jgi:hypothetical protein
MAYGDFRQTGNAAKLVKIQQIQIVAGVDYKTDVMCRCSGVRKPLPDRVCIARSKGGGIWLCIEFNAIRADFSHLANLGDIRIHEQTDPASNIVEFLNYWIEAVAVFAKVPSMIGGGLAGQVRHQRALVRSGVADQLDEFRVRVPLNVEFDFWGPRKR